MHNNVKTETIRVMGVDPGLATAGFGVVERASDRKATFIGHDDITTKPTEKLAERLLTLANWLRLGIKEFQPHCVAIEETFYSKNPKTTVLMAHGRGALIVAAAEAGLPVFEYSALSVKQSITGYGRASKLQLAKMVGTSLGIDSATLSSHAFDGLALGLCHIATVRHPSVAKVAALRQAAKSKGSQRRGKSSWRQIDPKTLQKKVLEKGALGKNSAPKGPKQRLGKK